MIHEIIQNNFICLILCILFAVYVINDRSFEMHVKKDFLALIVIILCLVVADNLEITQAALRYPTMMRRVCTGIGYALRPVAPFLMISILNRSNQEQYSIRSRVIFSVLLVLNGVMALCSIWTEWVFIYDEQNAFIRGKWGFMPFVAGLFYTFIMVLISRVRLRIKRRGETAVVIMLAFLSVIGTVMEAKYHYVNMLTGECAVGVVLYYLYLHVMVYSSDALTNAYTRRIYFQDIHNVRCADAVIVAIDLNELKQLNDRHGHDRGDEALTLLATTAMRYMPKGCSLYRMGGDEFAMICRRISSERVEKC